MPSRVKSLLSGRRWLLALTGLVLALLGAETSLRWAIEQSTWSRLANPEAYFDPLCDEDYWLALGRGAWGASLGRPGSHEQDPDLGWIPDRRNLDKSGAWPTLEPRETGRILALFGDSYVFGTVDDGERISDVLQDQLPSNRVLNFAVGGYGLDQTILRFEDRLELLSPGDQVVLGVLTTDLDRVVLSVRDAPKPRFEMDSAGELQLHLPESGEIPTWFAAHPPLAASLLWARIERTRDLLAASSQPSTLPHCRVEEKVALTRALLRRAAQTCFDHRLQCTMVLFYRPIDLEHGGGWRSELVRGLASSMLPLLDTRPLLLEHDEGWQSLYGEDEHPNIEGNQVLAGWIESALNQAP